MYSQQRRSERYKIIYTWKILEGLVPNCGINLTNSDRRGRSCIIPTSRGSTIVKNLREQSFQVMGPKLFNILPKQIRNMQKVSVEQFKEKLDLYLATLPDTPKICEMTPTICNQLTAKPSNSLLDVAVHYRNVNGGG